MSAVATPTMLRFAGAVPAELVELAGVRDALNDALIRCGWDEEDRFRVLICADEAMANAATHGSPSTASIDIRFTIRGESAHIVISDDHVVIGPLPTAPPSESSEHGRGLIIMRALTDRLRVWQRTRGLTVAMAFRPNEGGV